MLRTILVSLSLALAAPANADTWINDRTDGATRWRAINFDSLFVQDIEGVKMAGAAIMFCQLGRTPECQNQPGNAFQVVVIPVQHCIEGQGKAVILVEHNDGTTSRDTMWWGPQHRTQGTALSRTVCRLALAKAAGKVRGS